jgi:hypothetical protein
MGVHIIIEQMGRVDSKNQAKIVMLKKWLIVTPN